MRFSASDRPASDCGTVAMIDPRACDRLISRGFLELFSAGPKRLRHPASIDSFGIIIHETHEINEKRKGIFGVLYSFSYIPCVSWTQSLKDQCSGGSSLRYGYGLTALCGSRAERNRPLIHPRSAPSRAGEKPGAHRPLRRRGPRPWRAARPAV